MKVREIMTVQVVTVRPDTSLKEAARLMAARGISGLPVVDEGRVVGILTEADFVDRTAGHGRASLLDVLMNRDDRHLYAADVGDAMTTPVISVGPDDGHVDAARLMKRKHVKRLPVLDDNGRLLGVVSRSDILAVFTRPDEVIEQDIRHRIIGQLLAIEPDRLSVEVEDGHVRLEGSVQARTEAALLEELIAGVDGVWSVESNVRFLVDDTQRHDETRPFGVPRPNW